MRPGVSVSFQSIIYRFKIPPMIVPLTGTIRKYKSRILFPILLQIYAAAKEGIRALSRVAATEWGPDEINVNVICPLAWTSQLEQFQANYSEAFRANVKMPPMGHYGNYFLIHILYFYMSLVVPKSPY